MRLGDMLAKEARNAERAVQLDRPDRPGCSSEAVLRIFHGEWHLEYAPIGESVPIARHRDRSHEQVEHQAHPNNTLRCHTEDRRQNTTSSAGTLASRGMGVPLSARFFTSSREDVLRTRNILSIYHMSTSSTRLSVYNGTPMPAPFPGALPLARTAHRTASRPNKLQAT